MSDPIHHRSAYAENIYVSEDPYAASYAPDGYNSSHNHNHNHTTTYNNNSNPQLQLSQSRYSPPQMEPYYPSGPAGEGFRASSRSSQHHHHYSAHSRSRSRRGSSGRSRSRSSRHHGHDAEDAAERSDDSSSKSHRHRHGRGIGKKEALGVVVGAGAGGWLGHEVVGGGTVGTVSGMLVGAIGAQALERRRERYDCSIFYLAFFAFQV